MKTPLQVLPVLLILSCLAARAQVNSGSNGSDGAFHPTVSTNINMADHPDGIYHYTSVNIPAGVTVSFTPNANNSPVVWLVQSNCVITGTVDVSAPDINFASNQATGGRGGPGGFRGGNAAGAGAAPGDGWGPGGGHASMNGYVGNGSFATLGATNGYGQPGEVYGNTFLVPLIGGSGGSGGNNGYGGLGGGGAILIASSTSIVLNGNILAQARSAYSNVGNGSGGAVRLVATTISGGGFITSTYGPGGQGRVRLDGYDNTYSGGANGVVTRGLQPIVILPANQAANLSILSIANAPIPSSPLGKLTSPDIIIPAQQANPIPIVVRCSNIPLNTPITVTVKPANGPSVSATANNTVGTAASSTATVNLNMPRGGGIIYATTVVGLSGQQASLGVPEKISRLASAPERGFSTRSTPELAGGSEKSERLPASDAAAGHRPALRELPLSVTGWTASGERFAQMEITAALGGKQEVTYITESGKRYLLAAK